MQLLTETLKKRFLELGSQDIPDPIVIARFFDPIGSATWWVTAYDPRTNCGFGYVTGLQYDEWGYFSSKELEAIRRPFGLSIERDILFKEAPISKVCPSGYLY